MTFLSRIFRRRNRRLVECIGWYTNSRSASEAKRYADYIIRNSHPRGAR